MIRECFRVSGSVEIERKFLVEKRPPPTAGRGTRILQGYFPSRGALEIRLRRKGAGHFITFKSGTGARREEVELPIPRAVFARLWRYTTDGRIAKRRHKLSWGNVCIELDVYEGPHRGLITAEVEFDSVAKCRAFRPPDWLGREVTGQKAYGNHTLARSGRAPAKRKQK